MGKTPPFYVLSNGPPQVVCGRYSDVHEVFSDPARFSSEVPRTRRGYEQFDKFMGVKIIAQIDGERHARLRRLLMPAFSSRSMMRIEASITEIIDEMLDAIERRGNAFDGMEDYGAQLVVGALLTAMVNPSTYPASLRPRRNAATVWANGPGDPILRNPTTGIAGCCARTANGHVAAPPSLAMNSRRRIPPSRKGAGRVALRASSRQDRFARFGEYANGSAIVPAPHRLRRPSAIRRRHTKSTRSHSHTAKSNWEICAVVRPG
jgi:hypothetical protein